MPRHCRQRPRQDRRARVPGAALLPPEAGGWGGSSLPRSPEEGQPGRHRSWFIAWVQLLPGVGGAEGRPGWIHLRGHQQGIRRDAGLCVADPDSGPVADRGLCADAATEPGGGPGPAAARAKGRNRARAGGQEMSEGAGIHTNGNGTGVADTPEHRDRLLAGPLKIALLVAVVGAIAYLILGGLVYSMTPAGNEEEKSRRVQQFFLSLLTGYMFWVLVGFGSVFFLLVQYVTG